MTNLLPGDLRDLREFAERQEFWPRRVLLQLVDSYDKWCNEVDELENEVTSLESELMERDAQIDALSNKITDLELELEEAKDDGNTRGNQGTGNHPGGPTVQRL